MCACGRMRKVDVASDGHSLAHHDAVFARRMRMAGILPSDRIGIAVSGGPDSMALCVLTERWWRSNHSGNSKCTSTGHAEGVIGLVVDHGLRDNSELEAKCVQKWVSDMGFACDILRCHWPRGMPPQPQLQEAARDARYTLLQHKCELNGIPILLTAHHADDQAELFIMRLSRKSGVAGLAGMAFVSDLAPRLAPASSGPRNGVLLIRPLLDFRKQHLKNVCEEVGQRWMDDPTNANPAFLRSRVREALSKAPPVFKEELANFIISCRETRGILDRARDKLLSEAVKISEEFGYATLDIGKLAASNADSPVQFRVVVAILQYVGQREKPPRGRIVQTLLDKMRGGRMKGALEAGGCFICASPGTKGSVVMFTWSPDSTYPVLSPFRQRPPLLGTLGSAAACDVLNKARQRKAEILSEVSRSTQDMTSEPKFLSETRLPGSHSSILEKARSLGLISDASKVSLETLTTETSKDMLNSPKTPHSTVEIFGHQELRLGDATYIWDRFWVTLASRAGVPQVDASPCDWIAKNQSAQVRPFQEKDWIYLSQIGAATPADGVRTPNTGLHLPTCHCHGPNMASCASYTVGRARAALRALKQVPLPARRGLPSLVSSSGLLLSVPAVGFHRCPCTDATTIYGPRHPLGGGTASWW